MYGALYTTVDIVFNIIVYALIARVVISWLPIQKDNSIIRMLYTITEPILAPIRGMIERSSFGKNMMLDFSPIVAFLLIEIIKNIILRFLRY